MLNPIIDYPKSHGGSGLWGKIAAGVGGLGAAVAAPFTAGTSLAAIPAIVGAASVGGGIANELLNKPSFTPPSPGPDLLSSVSATDPKMQYAQLADARNALGSLVLPKDVKDQLHNHFTTAMEALG